MAKIRSASVWLCVSAWFPISALAGQAATSGGEKSATEVALARKDQWPGWRGPFGTGAAPDANPPLSWGPEKNIKWKVPMVGNGYATPIVWGDRVFLTAVIPFGPAVPAVPDNAPGAHDNAPVTRRQEYVALAFSRTDGKPLWKTSLRKHLPHAGAHNSATLASASPVADGEHVFAFFGSSGLYCLDHSGKQVWDVDLGDMSVKHGHGEGSSPVLHEDTIAINWDHEGGSFVVAFDKRTGKERWRKARDEVTSWATPIVYVHEGTPQLIVSGTKRIRAYDLRNGDVIWECGGLSNNVVASPVAADGMVIAGSSYVKRAMLGIRLRGAKGDITATDNVAWRRQRRTPYVPSPLLYGEWVYFLNHYQGVLSRVRAETGAEPEGPFRIHGVFELYASPVGAAGRVYFVDRDGTTVVISHTAGAPKVLATNLLEDNFNASPAIAGDELFLRGTRFLYCLAETPAAKK